MTAFWIFSVTLIAGVLMSGLAARGPLSVAVLFLLSGFALGAIGVPAPNVTAGLTETLAIAALTTVLFTDGARLNVATIRRRWRNPARALLLGLPITLALTAFAAKYIAGLPWTQALLLGAVLSPTDPVLISDFVRDRRVPRKLRRLLSVESGFNDGLALPLVIFFLGRLGSPERTPAALAASVAGALVLGGAAPFVANFIARISKMRIAERYRALYGLGLFFFVASSASLLGANEYLACFAAGLGFGASSADERTDFLPLGDAASEALKLAAVFLFGSLAVREFSRFPTAAEIGFVVTALIAVRPLALAVSFFRSDLTVPQRIVAGWFGPKGFASAAFGLLIAHAHIDGGAAVFRLVTLTITGSILAHTSTDALAARWYSGPR